VAGDKPPYNESMHSRDNNAPILQIEAKKMSEKWRHLRDALPPGSQIIPVLKANAYGLGVNTVLTALSDRNIKCVAVFSLEEAISLRQLNQDCAILLLSEVSPESLSDVMAYQLTPSVHTTAGLSHIIHASETHDQVIPIHLFYNSGANWFGRNTDAFDDLLQQANAALKVKIAGIYTHLPNAESDCGVIGSSTDQHIQSFLSLKSKLESVSFTNGRPLFHCANSDAATYFPSTHLDALRIGKDLLCGVSTLSTTVNNICLLQAGDIIGYGGEYQADAECQIAVINMGYADGLSTRYSNAVVEIAGHCFPIVGRISMDVCFALVPPTHAIRAGEKVVFFSPKGDGLITQDDYAKSMMQNIREVTCALGPRVQKWLS
jgi:alanine racemase